MKLNHAADSENGRVSKTQLVDAEREGNNVTVEQYQPPEDPGATAASALRHLRSSLRLTYNQLGRIFGVDAQTAREWSKETRKVPVDKTTEVVQSGQSLDVILSLIKEESVPSSVRNTAEAFDGRRAID